VADVDQSYALAAKAANQRKQAVDVFSLEAAGWLVHQYDTGSRGNGAAYLDDLPRGERQISNPAVGPNFRVMKGLEHLERPRARAVAVYPAPPRLFAAQQDVLSNAQVGA
jgi:hypothetical protein